jgi:hypothetical protein
MGTDHQEGRDLRGLSFVPFAHCFFALFLHQQTPRMGRFVFVPSFFFVPSFAGDTRRLIRETGRLNLPDEQTHLHPKHHRDGL